MRADHLAALNAARAGRRTVAYVVPLAGGEGRVVYADALTGDPLEDAVRSRFHAGTSGRAAGPGGEVFVRVYRPAPRLVLIGAVHVSQTLAPMAAMAGFQVEIVDPREAFATAERFGAHRPSTAWPGPDTLSFDEETAVATLTHDPKIDDPALIEALKSPAFYVGALGSRRTHAARVERLTAAGFDAAAIGRIAAPIGLPIGAAAPAEIAVAVLAQVIAALRRVAP